MDALEGRGAQALTEVAGPGGADDAGGGPGLCLGASGPWAGSYGEGRMKASGNGKPTRIRINGFLRFQRFLVRRVRSHGEMEPTDNGMATRLQRALPEASDPLSSYLCDAS